MIVILDDYVISFGNLSCQIYDQDDTDNTIRAELFNKYGLNPMKKYKIFYEPKITANGESSFFVYFADIETIDFELQKHNTKYIDFAIYAPQIFGYILRANILRANILLANEQHLFVFAENRMTALCLFENTELKLVKRFDDKSEIEVQLGDIDFAKITQVHICKDVQSSIAVMLKSHANTPIKIIEPLDVLLENQRIKEYAYNFSTRAKPLAIHKRVSGRMIISVLLFTFVLSTFEFGWFYLQKIDLDLKISQSKAKLSKSKYQTCRPIYRI
jgi:hypothetical protein